MAAGGVYMDFKGEKVSNRWIVFGICLGVFWEIRSFGATGIPRFAAGFLLPLFLLYPLFFIRALGAGDLKLLAVIGGFLGVRDLIPCMVFTFCFGACMALAILIARRSLAARLHYFFQYFQRLIRTGEILPYGEPGRRPENFHFTAAILPGVLFWLGGGW